MNPNITSILKKVEEETKDPVLSQSVYFGPTAMTHIRRLIEMGGTIITDTVLLANDIDTGLLGDNGTQILCFIDDPQVVYLAKQRHVTRAEVAVDYILLSPGAYLPRKKTIPPGLRPQAYFPAALPPRSIASSAAGSTSPSAMFASSPPRRALPASYR